ncbi:MAG: P-type conjugative transfer protein TrbJ [Hyphomonadaceae bacterium]
MKRILVPLYLALLPVAGFTPQASAQIVVYDPANHVQWIISAARAVEQVTNQIQQLVHEIEMLERMARNLERMPGSIADEILRKLGELTIAIEEAEGIGYKVEEIEREYEILYPKDYGNLPPRQQVLVREAKRAWEQSRSAYKDALLVQAHVVQSIKADLPELDRLLELSTEAEGNLSVLQTGNELTALGIKQDMQLQELMAAQYRAEALRRSEERAIEARAKARLENFLGDGNAYTRGGR